MLLFVHLFVFDVCFYVQQVKKHQSLLRECEGNRALLI